MVMAFPGPKVRDWSAHYIGALDPEKTLRILTPELVSLTIGIHIILSSFLLSVLGMNHGR
jgi:hypothetical protein